MEPNTPPLITSTDTMWQVLVAFPGGEIQQMLDLVYSTRAEALQAGVAAINEAVRALSSPA